jgi:hypothetical protein
VQRFFSKLLSPVWSFTTVHFINKKQKIKGNDAAPLPRPSES